MTALPEILDRYNAFAVEKNKELDVQIRHIKGELAETEKGISNIVDAVVSTGSTALANKLDALERRKAEPGTALTEIMWVLERIIYVRNLNTQQKRLENASND